jgi:hypothetical protein
MMPSKPQFVARSIMQITSFLLIISYQVYVLKYRTRSRPARYWATSIKRLQEEHRYKTDAQPADGCYFLFEPGRCMS